MAVVLPADDTDRAPEGIRVASPIVLEDLKATVEGTHYLYARLRGRHIAADFAERFVFSATTYYVNETATALVERVTFIVRTLPAKAATVKMRFAYAMEGVAQVGTLQVKNSTTGATVDKTVAAGADDQSSDEFAVALNGDTEYRFSLLLKTALAGGTVKLKRFALWEKAITLAGDLP